MRVYEFSKQFGIPTKELLKALEQGGFALGSHMSVIPQDALDFLNKKFKLTSPAHQEKAIDKKVADIKMTMQPAPKVVPTKPVQPEPVENKAKQETSNTKVEQKPVDKAVASQPEKKAHRTPEITLPQTHAQGPMVLESMTVSDFAHKTKKQIPEVIVTLLKWGVVAAKNQILTEDTVARLARHYELEFVQKPKEKTEEAESKGTITVDEGEFATRPPVVVVLGHVDHGKTTLLDFVRKTRVAAREKGGITQHLGAYEASIPQGNIIFIDTPGHEAFSKMRMRGIKVADIVVLVVAADDSVMPQTIEAIKQAKSMNVPIIVAVNKIDKVDISRMDVIKRDLAQHDLLPEDWGGDIVVTPISAKTGQGVDHLLEMIILQSQLMDLTASMTGAAKGYVLEAKLEKGRGPVATLLCQHGTLRINDYFVAGSTHGKVTSMVDSRGRRITEAKPAIPVLVAGFSDLPNAGDYFEVVSANDYKTAKSKPIEFKNVSPKTFLNKSETINIIIKTDSNSSKEAILGSIQKLSKKFEKKFNVVNAAVGGINEGDVDFAQTTGSLLIGLHVKVEPNAVALAHKKGVSIQLYDIIYKLLEALEAIAEGAKPIKMIRTKIGEAVVRQVFDIKGLGVIAGCYVADGRVTKDCTVVVLRGNRKVGEGKIKSLQRDKKSVKEVHTGFECGFIVDGFQEWAVDDRVECYLEVAEQPKK